MKKLGKANAKKAAGSVLLKRTKGRKPLQRNQKLIQREKKDMVHKKPHRRKAREADHAVVGSGWLERRTMPLFSDAGWRSVHGCC